MPKVGVVFVTRDRTDALLQAIESIGGQELKKTWKVCRVVLFDDRSLNHAHHENKAGLALACKDSPLPMEPAYERHLIPRTSPAYYWKIALKDYLNDLDYVAFLPDTISLLPNWFEALSRPLRDGSAEWTWGKVDSWRDGKVVRKWGGDLNLRQLRHNNYIHLGGAMFSRLALAKLNPIDPHDLARFHYAHDLILRAASGMKGKHIPEAVAIDNPLGPYPMEELALLGANEQRIHIGWWHRQIERIVEVGSSSVPS